MAYTGKSSSVKVLSKRRLKLPKLGSVKTSATTRITGKIKRYTVMVEPTGKYYIAVVFDVPDQKPLPKTGKMVGIDVGLTDLAILSDGTKFAKFDSKGYESQVNLKQRSFGRRLHTAKVAIATDKNKGLLVPRELSDFKNVAKAKVSRAIVYDKLKNARLDYLHKITTELVNTYDVIVLEDLRVSNMIKNHKLAKAIANASWFKFRELLEYKAERCGKSIEVVNPQNTSRLCSNCHKDSGPKPLHIREWTCSYCGVTHDRDINAAINILNLGLKRLGII